MKKNTLISVVLLSGLLISCGHLSHDESKNIATRTSPQNKQLVLEKSKTSLARVIERNHYQNLVAAFERNDDRAFLAALSKMKSQHQTSLYMDDAIYMSGMWHFAQKEYGPALQEFQQVIDEYPKGNRAASALYAKAVVLKRLNLNSQARSVFQLVRQKYPKSQLAWRAKAEMSIKQ